MGGLSLVSCWRRDVERDETRGAIPEASSFGGHRGGGTGKWTIRVEDEGGAVPRRGDASYGAEGIADVNGARMYEARRIEVNRKRADEVGRIVNQECYRDKISTTGQLVSTDGFVWED